MCANGDPDPGADDAAGLPNRRWVTKEADHTAPQVGGYEMTTTCVCGATLTQESFSAYDTLSCEACGRAFKVNFEQVEGATRKHPVCPECHSGMTKGSGYWCPDCDVSINSAFIDEYEDVLREYQLTRWLADLRDACSMHSTDWHSHGRVAQDGTLAHCRVCCPDCDDCDCVAEDAWSCSHGNDGETILNLRCYSNRTEVYRRVRRMVDESGRFECAAEQRAQKCDDGTANHLSGTDLLSDAPFDALDAEAANEAGESDTTEDE